MASTLARSSRCCSRQLAASGAASSSLAAMRSSTSSAVLASQPPITHRTFSSSIVRCGLSGNSIEHRRQAPPLPSSSSHKRNKARNTSVASTPAQPIYRRQRREAQKEDRRRTKKEKEQKTLAAQMGLNQSKLTPFVRTDRQFKTFKPITPSIRWLRYNLNPHLHKGDPVKALTVARRGTGGRNHHGHITVRGRGGGHKRRLRMVDFWRWEDGPQTVVRIEYDPGRSAHIALLRHNETGKISYILAPDGLRAGDDVRSYRSLANVGAKKPTSSDSEAQDEGEGEGESPSSSSATSALDMGIFRTQAVRPGNVLPLHLIPVGTMIHAVSLVPTGPAKLIRSAGSSGRLVSFVNRSKAATTPSSAGTAANNADASAPDASVEGEATVSESTTHAQIRLQSGEVRLVTVNCVAAIGRVSNTDHKHRRLGKAGRSRWLGRRPKVRGVAMNKVDHPHGGGRGKSKSNMHPKSIYGHKAEGRTRKPGTRRGNKMVIKERPRQLGARKG